VVPTKQCPACKETKDADKFYWNRKRKCLGTYCKPCHKIVQRRWQQQNPEKVAEISRRRKQRRLEVQKITRYGVTPERYAEMLSDQDFGCAICGFPETARTNDGETRSLAIDHCHQTEFVRGLLCSRCNNGLGHFEDDMDRLMAAIIYLQIAKTAERESRQKSTT
jgi:hypothetical protein